jgi:uncharacterized SAM-binding protein YcdF (DUF218 family)
MTAIDRLSNIGRGATVAAAIVAFLWGGYLLWTFASDRIGQFLVQALEQRFQRTEISFAETLTGVIVLIGGDKRLEEAGRLARLYPHLKVVISGAKGMSGVQAGLGSGIEPSRIALEITSRNTYENALYSARLIQPKRGEQWLLVTGASHIPRSIGSFRGAGFPVEPWPVYDLILQDKRLVGVAMREWLALIVYRFLGRTDALFPAPQVDAIRTVFNARHQD